MIRTRRPLPRPLAAARAVVARRAMAACRLCAHRCSADRSSGPAGRCRSDSVSRIFHEGIEWAGEGELVPTAVLSLSGCNMTCSFCLTGASSQDGRAGTVLDPDAWADRLAAGPAGLKSVTLLGGEPSIHLDGALEIAARVPRHLQFVWKTNAYASAEALDLLGDIPDVVLADFKFGNDACANQIAGVPSYTEIVRANLIRSARHSRLIVRHLLMPGHLKCCLEPVAVWLARQLPGIPISLMTGYLPVFRASADPVLGRTNRGAESEEARALVRSLGLREEPWTLASPVPGRSSRDELWIDREGRVCVDSASPELVAALKRLGPEFVLSS